MFKTQFPIIQAPMLGGITTPEFVAAVSNAGGLGSLGASHWSASQITQQIQKIVALTDKPFAVNLLIPDEQSIVSTEQVDAAKQLLAPYYESLGIEEWGNLNDVQADFDAQMQAVITAHVPIFSFSSGVLKQHYVDALKQNKTLVIGTATTVEEAKQLEAVGVDAIVAQGEEAGGQRATFADEVESSLVPTGQLVEQCLQALSTPIIATGGIMDADQAQTMLDLGAIAVQMGTAFLTCDEANVEPCYKDALLAGERDDTALTRAFSGHYERVVSNRVSADLEQFRWLLPPYPIQHALTKKLRQVAGEHNDTDLMPLWAGRNYYQCKAQSVAGLMRALTQQMVPA